jgi:hypothetical protein
MQTSVSEKVMWLEAPVLLAETDGVGSVTGNCGGACRHTHHNAWLCVCGLHQGVACHQYQQQSD